ncbi:MAG TPA: lysophospholipid acyltransferase family protein [bacterium]|nr:lysophospholipid acyltransferase family protein [bacterium]
MAFIVTRTLSPSGAMKLAEGVGALLFLRRRRRRISIENISAAFPGKPQKEVEAIGRGAMAGMVKVIFECLRIPVIARDPEKYIETRGEENVWNALEQKKGLILVVSHFGNWELMAVAAAAKGFPIHAIGKPVKNPFVYRFIKRLRGATGLKSIDKKGAIKETVRLLKQNQIVAILIDEHVKKGEMWVDFFGRKAAVSALPAMLSLKYGAPVIPTFYYRESAGRSVFIFEKPFDLIKAGDSQKDMVSNTQQYARRLEEEIRKRPRDWTLWMHNRWREQEG